MHVGAGNNFTCLEMVLTSTGTSFTKHITFVKEKPTLRYVNAGTRLFNIKLVPLASIAIQLIWDKFTAAQLRKLDRVNTAVLKRLLGVHSSTLNVTCTYLLVKTLFIIEDVKRQCQLQEIDAYCNFTRHYELKMIEFDPFFSPQTQCTTPFQTK